MNRRFKRHIGSKKSSRTKEIILSHIQNNIKEYFIATIIFLIGIVIGVIFINNTSETQSSEIISYINTFINGIKENQEIDELALLKDSISKNCVLAILLWFIGSTVIGISIVYIILAFRGFCLGYTISSIILTCGIRQRNFVFAFYSFAPIYYICTLYNSTDCKWYEVAQLYNER